MKVLVTCPPMLKAIDEFRHRFEKQGLELVTPDIVQTLSEQELIGILPDMDAWIIGDDPATAQVFAAGKKGKLKAAVKWGVGTDNVDFKAAAALNIPISNTPKMFGGEVADIAINYIIGLARETFYIDREVRNGRWVKPPGLSISGKTVALVGLGDIGHTVAKRLMGFDVNIIAYDPFTKMSPKEAIVKEILPFPEKIGLADFIVLTCSLTAETHHLINRDLLAKVKKGVFLINVSRGKLVDEKELIMALENGVIAGAGLDVFEDEPLPADSPLRQFDRCIFGTHNGSNTREAVRRATNKAIEILFGYLNLAE